MKDNAELRATLNDVLARIGTVDGDGPVHEWETIAADLVAASAYATKTLRMWDAARAYRARLAGAVKAP